MTEGRATGPRSGDQERSLLMQLLEGQAAAEVRFDDVFRRLGLVETSAGEARDAALKTATILREQDVLTRVVEVRNEGRSSVADLRADLVRVATEHDGRIKTLEKLRNVNDGVSAVRRFGFRLAELLAQAGVVGIVLKLLGVHL